MMRKSHHPIRGNLVLSVDVVLFAINNFELLVLLPHRTEDPFTNVQALPGVAVRIDETLQQAAQRALISKGAFNPALIETVYLEQLAAFDALYRDPRGRTVSIAFLGLLRITKELQYSDLTWHMVSEIVSGRLPFDHEKIIETGLTRLQGKLKYTNIASHLIADRFRIEELQTVYEAVLGRRLNRTNFRTKLLKIGLIEQIGILEHAVGSKGGRPPHLYRFSGQSLETVERDFL